ncbi:uncharacterized protein METZ01_LOCUS100406 [marine metagenome]|jgi:hypothetical protein|uniref:Uncharacterized protein n=1 Tax=marine metagenome TaxID=408172 RepID=A0A381W509_9ZZZZ|tara:strand:+ start:198 stop:506 length:309 start_codon:yes stop_codon:yes gene_type:complete
MNSGLLSANPCGLLPIPVWLPYTAVQLVYNDERWGDIMKSTEASTIREALKRVGIELASDRIDELKEIYVQYLSQLEDMHNLDLDTSEVTGVFLPGPISELK